MNGWLIAGGNMSGRCIRSLFTRVNKLFNGINLVLRLVCRSFASRSHGGTKSTTRRKTYTKKKTKKTNDEHTTKIISHFYRVVLCRVATPDEVSQENQSMYISLPECIDGALRWLSIFHFFAATVVLIIRHHWPNQKPISDSIDRMQKKTTKMKSK